MLDILFWMSGWVETAKFFPADIGPKSQIFHIKECKLGPIPKVFPRKLSPDLAKRKIFRPQNYSLLQ